MDSPLAKGPVVEGGGVSSQQWQTLYQKGL